MALRECSDCSSQISDQATECPNCGRPQRSTATSRMVELLKSVPITIGVLTLVFGVVQYMKTQDWHRAEFIAEQMRHFESKLEVRETMKMIRWSGNTVKLFPGKQPGKDTSWITDEDLRLALRPRGPVGPVFSEDGARIRDYFDVFFAGLERFEHFIRAGLVDKNDLEPYLDQWLTLVGDPRRDKQTLLRKYVHCSGYSGVEHLIELWGLESAASIQCNDDAQPNVGFEQNGANF